MSKAGTGGSAKRAHHGMVMSAFSDVSRRHWAIPPRRLGSNTRAIVSVRSVTRSLLRSLGRLDPRVVARGKPFIAALAVKSDPLIQETDVENLIEVLRSHEIATSVLVDRAPLDGSVKEDFRKVAALPGSLRPRGVQWLSSRTPLGELARVVYEALVLDGLAATGRARVEVSLTLVQRIAPALPEVQAAQLIKPLWRLASAPSDPYSPEGHRAGASTALARLIATRRDIRPAVVELLTNRTPRERALILDIVARSVRMMGRTSPDAFRELVPSLKMTSSELDRFSQMSDLRERTMPDANHNGRERRYVPNRLRIALRVLYVLHPMAALGVAFWYVDRVQIVDPFDNFNVLSLENGIPLEVGIALIALMATIHVFTVQFATARLPAAVARVAGEPWQLWVGYVSAAALVAAIVAYPGSSRSEYWVVVETLLLFDTLIWLGITLSRTFHRTGTAEACRVYMRRHMHSWRRAGRQLGSFQVRAIELKQVVDPLPFAGFVGQREVVGHDLTRIDALRRGIFLPTPRSLSKVLAHPIFAGPGYLQFGDTFGVIVAQAGKVAIVRAGERRLPARLERRLARVLRPIRAKYIEDVSSDAITLAALAFQIAEAGDLRLAEEIADNAAQIVVSHLGEVQRARVRSATLAGLDLEGSDIFYPVTPALRDTLEFLVQRVLEREGLWRSADVIVRRCLSASVRDDRASMILVSLIGDAGQEFPLSAAAEWLRRAGLSALQCDDDRAFEASVRSLGKLAGRFSGESRASRALVSLCAASLRLRPDGFDVSWSEIVQWLQGTADEVAARVSLQVGASALDCGGFRAVVVCARYASTDPRYDILLKQTSLERVPVEAALAELSGIDVGEVATDRLEHFRDVVSAVRS